MVNIFNGLAQSTMLKLLYLQTYNMKIYENNKYKES